MHHGVVRQCDIPPLVRPRANTSAGPGLPISTIRTATKARRGSRQAPRGPPSVEATRTTAPSSGLIGQLRRLSSRSGELIERCAVRSTSA
jgi:hypothetical protein